MPKPFYIAALVLVILAIIPVVLIARARAVKFSGPKTHIIHDMDHQPKFKTQNYNRLFADRRAMRPEIPGTVARGSLIADEAYQTGKQGGEFIEEFPIEVTQPLLQRGQERYEIFCAMCHGLAGYGDGIIGKRAEALQEGTWVPPSSYHTDQVRERPVGHLFNTITHGIRNMAAYRSQIPGQDRWAIVAYIRALQKSQNANIDDVPQEYREDLK